MEVDTFNVVKTLSQQLATLTQRLETIHVEVVNTCILHVTFVEEIT